MKIQLDSLIEKLKNINASNENLINNNFNNVNDDNKNNNQIFSINNTQETVQTIVAPPISSQENLSPEPWPTMFTFPREKLSQSNIDIITGINSSTTNIQIYTILNEMVNILYNKMRHMRMVYPKQKHYQAAARSIVFAFPSFISLNMKVNIYLFFYPFIYLHIFSFKRNSSMKLKQIEKQKKQKTV